MHTPLPSKPSPSCQQGGFFGKLFLLCLIIGIGVFAVYAYGLDHAIVQKFENRRWDIPARVYSRPLILEEGKTLSKQDLTTWLNELKYSEEDGGRVGTYSQEGSRYLIAARGFDYGNGDIDKPQTLEITLKNNQILGIRSTVPSKEGFVRLEPIEIGKIYPDSNEDRELITKSDILGEVEKLGRAPTLQNHPLIEALIATEDRGFYEHYGVSIRGTTRAILNNFKGGSMQGGSTLTQQLIKNFYLTNERSLKRKANEAIMALLLERHYTKDEILMVYLNEINLGQNGNQSINGFGIASRFYFDKPINELNLDQYALLVGIAKGSSFYNPRKHPERALKRRNTVLHNMLTMGKIDQQTYEAAIAKPLGIVSDIKEVSVARTKFPDFLDYTRRELSARYHSKDLKTAGLRVVSTLDPLSQKAAYNAFNDRLSQLKKTSKSTRQLQGALVSANPKTGEVLALVGSGSEFTGFNRALDAKRQVGSLLKPIIYLTALESGDYNLASGVDDSEKSYKAGGKSWTPKNYGGKSYGVVPLTTALANSYNQAAVNVGMEVGLNHFINYLGKLGIEDDIPRYPSVLLGAVDLSPIQMLGMYQVLANGGVYSPLHSIDSVIDEKGKLLEKRQLRQEVRIPADASYLLHHAMTQVITDGTAKAALSLGDLNLAGKTGTTNDARDAWFAGYSGNYVSVVWVGRDDNKPIGLTGGTGALPIWIDYMKRLNLSKVSFAEPKGIKWEWIEQGTGRASEESCENAVYIPVKPKSVSDKLSNCHLEAQERARQAALLEEYGDSAVSLEDDGGHHESTPDEPSAAPSAEDEEY